MTSEAARERVPAAGIAAASLKVPPRTASAQAILQAEGVAVSEAILVALGIDEVHVCDGESGSALALAAARDALAAAGVEPAEVGAIIDYTVLPQEYLVPSWSMSNKLQADLGAKNAFTIGFSGGGATQFLLALKTAAALIRTNPDLDNVLLVGADVALPGNRVVGGETPVTVLGDGASAMVLRRDAAGWRVVDADLWSDGDRHDVCYIPGGALEHPARLDLYRLELDRGKYESRSRLDALSRVCARLLERTGTPGDAIAAFVPPNLSAADQAECARAAGMEGKAAGSDGRARYGCLHANDFVVNWLAVEAGGAMRKGERMLLASHGMGFLHGACLVQR